MLISIPIPQRVLTNKFYTLHFHQRNEIAWVFKDALIEYKNERVKNFPVEITYSFTLKGRMPDVDGVTAMCKMATDALVHWDILPDDSIKFINGLHIYAKKGNSDYVEIHIN